MFPIHSMEVVNSEHVPYMRLGKSEVVGMFLGSQLASICRMNIALSFVPSLSVHSQSAQATSF